MGVQTLAPELAVKAFDEAVVRRLARPGDVEHYTLVIGPQIEITRNEFTSVRVLAVPAWVSGDTANVALIVENAGTAAHMAADCSSVPLYSPCCEDLMEGDKIFAAWATESINYIQRLQ